MKFGRASKSITLTQVTQPPVDIVGQTSLNATASEKSSNTTAQVATQVVATVTSDTNEITTQQSQQQLRQDQQSSNEKQPLTCCVEDERARRERIARLQYLHYYNRSKAQEQFMKTLYPIGSEGVAHLGGGKLGRFNPIRNDFSIFNNKNAASSDEEDLTTADAGRGRFQNEPSWSRADGEKVKRVRFGICMLALLGLALGMMSRLVLNVVIVEMVKKSPLIVEGEETDEDSTLISVDEFGTTPSINDSTLLTSTTSMNTLVANLTSVVNSSDLVEDDDLDSSVVDLDAGLKFEWTKKEVNMILGAFYVGYIPGIMSGGAIATKYGSKYPLLVALLGSAAINLSTPLIARVGVLMMVASRITIGLIQGCLFPCLYDLFSKWLTATESSIFAPLIKVSMPMGALIGTLMPGILSTFGFKWPVLFYLGGSFCVAWCVLWFYVATSTPQENRFVEPNELRRIMRKKVPASPQTVSSVADKVSMANGNGCGQETIGAAKMDESSAKQQKEDSIPWLAIITNSSVLALTLVKYTYNACIDLIYLELALYLREVHTASIETISAIASGAYCMQMVLIAFVGWLAKTAVQRRVFGFGTTKWRKIFQGSSNLFMALSYFAIPLIGENLEPAACLLLSAAFFWMLGAGGESMVPYDLSTKYPATIVGLSHSISMLSGLSVPTLCQLILGEDTDDPSRWNLLFTLIGCAATTGGVVFVLVIEAKPFLPEEKLQRQQQLQQQQEKEREKEKQQQLQAAGTCDDDINAADIGTQVDSDQTSNRCLVGLDKVDLSSTRTRRQ